MEEIFEEYGEFIIDLFYILFFVGLLAYHFKLITLIA